MRPARRAVGTRMDWYEIFAPVAGHEGKKLAWRCSETFLYLCEEDVHMYRTVINGHFDGVFFFFVTARLVNRRMRAVDTGSRT